MSNYVYPDFPGLTFDIQKRPEFVTLVQRSLGGNETRASYYSNPIWHWTLPYSFLEAADYATLAAFFVARAGAFDSFLFSDPTETQAVVETVGVGNGVDKDFQLLRMVDGTAISGNTNVPAPTIYLGGVVATSGQYSVSTVDLISFVDTVPLFTVVAWSGDKYHRVRFATDALDFVSFMYQLYELKQVELVSVR